VTQVAPQSARSGHDASGSRRPRSRSARRGRPEGEESALFPSSFPDEEPTGGRLRGRHATGYDQGFAAVVRWTILGSILPGAGLIAAGRRTAGRLLLALSLIIVGGFVAFGLYGDATAFVLRFATNTNDLMMLAIGALALALLWAIIVIGTHISLRRFASLTAMQRFLSTALVVAIVGGGGMIAAKTASYSLIGRETLRAVTSNGTPITDAPRPKNDQQDPWAGIPRVNVLLIGSDAGADRTGVRTDSILVASIDTHTGDSVIFGLPRNLQHVPFPAGTPMAQEFPDGYVCAGQACLLNALWQFGVENAANPASPAYSYYKRFKNPGLQATIDGVEGVTGLKINDYALLDLAGFADFINAIHGLTVNVQRAIPVGGHENAAGQQVGVKTYIPPGRQHLNGYYTMWYARSRSDSSDYDRMQRQRCVIGAISQQVDPITLAQALPEIAKSIQKDMSTSIPLDDIGSWVTLALRIKNAHIRSLPFTDAVINTVNPDFSKIHALVQRAIEPPASTATPSPTATKKAGSGSKTTKAPQDPSKAVDVKEVC
jgi:polyisoprenyl-teichoic acid--peptidoglycan teichoic acid transferase